jgi:protein-disulfide isomerase
VRRVAALASALALVALGGCGKKGEAQAAKHDLAQVTSAPAPSPSPSPSAEPAAAKVAKPPPGPEPKLLPMILDGIDLDADARPRFFALYEQLPSPCGKPQSLHASVEGDASCKRAPYAARWVAHMMTLANLSDEQMIELYGRRYKRVEPYPFELDGVAHTGNPKTAKITLVEFFDYGCPHCKAHVPVFDAILKKLGKDAVLYYMNFPIGGWATSEPAAQAALAADRQGKFDVFHHALFEAQPLKAVEDIRAVAKKVGLDMTKFEADWKDPAIAAAVKAQRAQGAKANLQSTPMIWVNGREFIGIPDPAWLSDAIAEEQAALSK